MNETLRETAQQLGHVLRLAPETAAYHAAVADYQADEALMTKVSRFQTVLREFQQAQRQGGVTWELVGELRQLQEEINSHPLVLRVAETQEALKGPARGVNAVITDVLAIDFAANAGSGGCCG